MEENALHYHRFKLKNNIKNELTLTTDINIKCVQRFKGRTVGMID